MMAPVSGSARRRVALYGVGTAVLGALVYGGFVYRAEPDLMTLLGGADLHLRVAAVLPERGKDGKPVPAREDNLRRVEEVLTEVERREPGLSVTLQFRAYVAYLRSDVRSALQLYRQAMAAKDFQTDQRPRILLDIAKLHQQLAQYEQALVTLGEFQAGPAIVAEAALVRAQVLRSQRRDPEALNVLRAVAAASAEQGGMVLDCAQLLAELGDLPAAAAVAESAAARCDAQGLYQIANLKFRAGQTDTAISVLEQAVRADPVSVHASLRRDRTLWERARKDPRFTKIEMLISEPAAAPGR